MAETSATEYPAMLAYLQPTQAVHTLNDRVKRVTKINVEIADWLQERRKVEEQYVQGLRRLMQFKVPNASSELGTFQDPWNKILQLVDAVASSHHQFASRIEKDVEYPLRAYSQKKEVHNMQTIATNLASIAKELEDAQEKSDKLARKGTRASTQKVDAAATRLSSASQQWESQAPFIFETLQVLDEQRVNQLRDLLTQFLTHESDQAQRSQLAASETLQTILEIDTSKEILGYSKKVTDGKVKSERKPAAVAAAGSRRPSTVDTGRPSATDARPPSATETHLSPPATATTTATTATRDDEAMSETSGHEPPPQPRLRSRIGTMINRRRQSIHGGFGPITQKTAPSFGSGSSFGRTSRSRDGRGVSPRASVNDLTSAGKLPSLAELPNKTAEEAEPTEESGLGARHAGTNGVKPASSMTNLSTAATPTAPTAPTNGNTDAAAEFLASLGAPLSHTKSTEAAEGPKKDAEGFTIPPAMNDPISQAQREANEDAERLFNLNIQSTPVTEDDPDAAKAALSNVTSALQQGMPLRKGTVRGRRDVRSSIYVTSPNGDGAFDNPVPVTPPMPPMPSIPSPPSSHPTPSRPPAIAALASEASVAGTSDSQSVRSGTSLGTLAQAKHPESSEPGLNASIIETMTASFEDGAVKNAKIGGEIAFSYNPEDPAKPPPTPRIRINNFANLEVIGPNRIFVQNALPDRNDEYTLDVSHLSKTATAFTYRIEPGSPEGIDLAAHAPLLIRPLWKPKGERLELLMQYCLNPSSGFTAPVALQNVVIFATYEGGRASGAQTKPSGTHLKEKHLVYWRLGDVTLTTQPQKIVCRVIGAENAELKPGHVEARWEYTPSGTSAESLTGVSVSRLQEGKGKGKELDADDPFADEENTAAAEGERWTAVPMAYRLVSGKYEVR
ncbi:related to SYP1 Protein with a potential role in actin cytoskeletal organization [Cephalotrichum gorgonifer]|uniref:Related to SYP1 Protein with a potential role in actin cytoskeletal organization n=1 Tax=Cephalotrichum gorgonifer TaxID=2041049 RepID=A0AAE8MT28_9PEZI|nr:related to SYP1 Protein with a potential role in actin cytoskeletal organization [Cephalotrichum gorgonifer]